MTRGALCLLLLGCSEPSSLFLDVRTDLVPEAEFDEVRVRYGDERVVRAVDADDPYYEGTRIAELGGLDEGSFRFEVALLDDGEVVVARTTVVPLEPGANGSFIALSRDCRDVVCDPEAGLTCNGGRCDDERCTETSPEACEATECEAASDCAVSRCARAECTEAGACFVSAEPDACDAPYSCEVDVGCVNPDTGRRLVDAAGQDYEVAVGYDLDVPVDPAQTEEAFMGRVRDLAFVPPGRGFSGEVLFLSSWPPEMHALDADGTVTSTWVSDRTSGPDQEVTVMLFSPPGSPYGNYLYYGGASPDTGDGIFRIGPDGTSEAFRRHNNVVGLVFDVDSLLHDPPPGFATPLIVNRSSYVLQTEEPELTGGWEAHDDRLPGLRPFRIFLPRRGFLADRLVMSSRRFPSPTAPTGSVWTIDSLVPYSGPELWLDDVDAGQLAFPDLDRFGDVMLMSGPTTGEIRAYRSDRSFEVLVSGLDAPESMKEAPDGSVWIVETGRGRIVRLIPPSIPP